MNAQPGIEELDPNIPGNVEQIIASHERDISLVKDGEMSNMAKAYIISKSTDIYWLRKLWVGD